MFSIDLEKFSGPLDALLTLIQKNKLDICEVSISKIADEFLDMIKDTNIYDAEMMSDFIYIASKLIEIKSKYMLFIQNEDDDENELVLSLEEYAKYKELSIFIKKLYSSDYLHFEKIPEEIFLKEELDLSKLTLENISKAIKITNDTEQKPIRFTRVQKSLTKKIEFIQEYVKEKESCFFEDILQENMKDEKVVSMLGVLHLARQNSINISQDKNFEKISIKSNIT